jgi:hypothetical protein
MGIEQRDSCDAYRNSDICDACDWRDSCDGDSRGKQDSMTTTGLAARVEQAMRRSRALVQQRRAAGIVLERYAAAPTVARWARRVARADEIGHYSLLYRVVDRGISGLL